MHAATHFLAIPAAQSGSNSQISPLVHRYSSCSSLEFRVLPFSLRPTLCRKSAARAEAVRRLTARARVCVWVSVCARASWHRAVTDGMLCAALGKVRKCWDWTGDLPCLLRRRTRYSPLSHLPGSLSFFQEHVCSAVLNRNAPCVLFHNTIHRKKYKNKNHSTLRKKIHSLLHIRRL